MKKIIVIGVTSSGKTTFAGKLAKKTGIPHQETDKLFWKPNWEQPSDEDFFVIMENATKDDKWILDGNYTRSNHITWPKADTIIWIDLPFGRTLYQCVSRALKRSLSGKELWEGTGNKESFWRMFSKDSIIVWLFKTYDKMQERTHERMNSEEYSHINFIHLRSHKEMNQFLESL